MEIDVSFVMTVYNKEHYLPHVLKAVLNQKGVKNPEYVFVDDVSSDKSVEIIQQATKGLKNVKIVINEKNMGISPTTNKAISLASGNWVRMLDSDDMLPIDSTQKMLELAEKHNADIVYGTFKKTGKKAEELTDVLMDEKIEYKHYPNALMGVLKDKFIRMGQLIKREVLQKSGAEERAFIQDESIPLRAAIHANGIIKMNAHAVLVPEEIGCFSGNKTQLNADRFLVYYHTILDNPGLPKDAIKLIYQRVVSAYWKEIRDTAKLPYLSMAFFKYIWVKLVKPMPNFHYMVKMKRYFDKKKNFRRTAKYV